MRSRSRGIVARGCGVALGACTLVATSGSGRRIAGRERPSGSTPGVTAKTITVGSISDISSPVPGLFAGAKVGAQAYFAYINSQGGVNGRKLILDGQDSAFSTGKIASEIQNIAANDFAIVGGFSLLDSAEQPVIDANKLPMVAEALSPSIFNDPNLYSAVPMVNNGGIEGPYKWIKSHTPMPTKPSGSSGTTPPHRSWPSRTPIGP